MRLVPSQQVYDADETVLRCIWRAARARQFFIKHPWWRIVLHAIGITGLALTCTVLVVDTASPLSKNTMLLADALSVTTTGVFCGVCASMYQSQLLRRLLTSFDFMLWVANVTIMHLAVADAIAWKPKALSLLASWIWILWAITMDALTPDLRQALGLRQRHLISVMLIFALLAILLAVELIFMQRWHAQNRVIALSRSIRIHGVQVFFSCLQSLLPMCCRIVWRLCHATHGELALIQGTVEYDDVLLTRRRQAEHEGQTKARASARVFSWLARPTTIQPTCLFKSSPDEFAARITNEPIVLEE